MVAWRPVYVLSMATQVGSWPRWITEKIALIKSSAAWKALELTPNWIGHNGRF